MRPLRIAIAGATGRMGQALIRLATADPKFRLVAAVTVPDDPRLGQDAGTVAGGSSVNVVIATQVSEPCDALIEFTSPAGCAVWAGWCAQAGVPLVSGTTGLEETQHRGLRAASARIPIVWSANMSIGANVLLGLVEDLAGRLGESWDIEVCETHHRAKVDAPSGTAQALVAAAATARGVRAPDVAVYGRSGRGGPRPRGQIGVHAIRMGAVVGEHEVHFASDAEALTLRHRAFSRDAFAAGALGAACWLQGRSPGMYSMRDVLQ